MLLLAGVSSCEVKKQVFWYKDVGDRSYEQVGRIGYPFLTEILQDEQLSELINEGDPETDVEKVRDLFAERVSVIRSSISTVPGFPSLSSQASSSSRVGELFFPNAIHLDFSKDLGFGSFNGFRYGDDAADTMLEIIFGRTNVRDEVDDENLQEKQPYLEGFPYLSGIH